MSVSSTKSYSSFPTPEEYDVFAMEKLETIKEASIDLARHGFVHVSSHTLQIIESQQQQVREGHLRTVYPLELLHIGFRYNIEFLLEQLENLTPITTILRIRFYGNNEHQDTDDVIGTYLETNTEPGFEWLKIEITKPQKEQPGILIIPLELIQRIVPFKDLGTWSNTSDDSNDRYGKDMYKGFIQESHTKQDKEYLSLENLKNFNAITAIRELDKKTLLKKPKMANEEFFQILKDISLAIPYASDCSILDSRSDKLLGKPNLLDTAYKSHINKESFMSGGKYAHLFIPQYPYVPMTILLDVKMSHIYNGHNIQRLWTVCFKAREEALKATKQEYGPNTPEKDNHLSVPWLILLQDASIKKSFYHDILDIIQYQMAINRLQHKEITHIKPKEFYDMFFRPLERLYASNMPLRSQILPAYESHEGEMKLINFLSTLAGFQETPEHLSRFYIVDQISRLRTLRKSPIKKD